MKALAESSLPSAAQARALFEEGMERWDEDKADRAVAVLYRTAGANDIAELFFRYGARDFRDVGHKAIYVANAWRILSTLGWRHAEPVLRSLAFALLAHDGTNPAHGDLEADRPWRENKPRAQRIRAGWQEGRSSREATLDLWAVLRSGAWRDACEKTVELVNAGISPDSLWDAFLLRAGELLMQQPGIFGIHCVTSANALRFAFDAAAGDETRRLLLLQQAAFLPMFRDAMKAHGPLAEGLRLDRLEPLVPTQPGEEAIAEIFRDMGASRERASRKILAWAGRPASDPQALARTARHLVANKAHNAHDYKFAAAALEDVHKISPSWRAHFLASAAYDLVPSTLSDSEITRATRAALP